MAQVKQDTHTQGQWAFSCTLSSVRDIVLPQESSERGRGVKPGAETLGISPPRGPCTNINTYNTMGWYSSLATRAG